VDRLAECAIFLGLLLYFHETEPSRAGLYATFLAATGSLLVSYARARAEGLGVACDVGVLERPERLVLLTAGLLAGRTALLAALVLLVALAYATALQRLVHVRAALLRSEAG
jgi:phosphatidylglycerophosphate synthase